MKKLYFLIYLSLIANLLSAQISTLVIKFTSGNQKSVLISNVKGIRFPTTTMKLYVVDGESEVFNKTDIQKMYFETITEIPAITDKGNDLAVYPNPTMGLVYFKNLPDKTSTLRIYTINGVQVFVGRIAPSVQSIDLGFLAKGVYLMNIDNKPLKLIKL